MVLLHLSLGHHAEPNEVGGFCWVNNVAIAIKYMVSILYIIETNQTFKTKQENISKIVVMLV